MDAMRSTLRARGLSEDEVIDKTSIRENIPDSHHLFEELTRLWETLATISDKELGEIQSFILKESKSELLEVEELIKGALRAAELIKDLDSQEGSIKSNHVLEIQKYLRGIDLCHGEIDGISGNISETGAEALLGLLMEPRLYILDSQ